MPNRHRSFERALTEVLRRRLAQGGPWPRELFRHVERESRARSQSPEEWLEGIESRSADFAALIAAATVSHTSFFRHPDHFEQVRSFSARVAANTPCVRVWSAGCSTGEEVWSLALCLTDVGVHFQIWAVDVNPRAIDIARSGIYPARATAGLPGYEGKLPFRAPNELRARVKFQVAALADRPPHDAPAVYDLIFCRNVMIYFEPEVVQRTWRTLMQHLAPWGAIAVAPVESLSHVPSELARSGPLGWMEWRTQRKTSPNTGLINIPETVRRPAESGDSGEVDRALELVARLLSRGDLDGAERALHHLLALRDDAVGWFLLGETCARREELTQAKIAYQRATKATHAPADVDLETIRDAARRRAQQLLTPR